MKNIGVSILGGTGYGAGELLRLLLRHPNIEIVSIVSSSAAGEMVTSTHRQLQGVCNFRFSSEIDFPRMKQFSQSVIISALPHGVAGKKITELLPRCLDEDIKILDLSGDLRLSVEALRLEHYGTAGVSQEIQQKFHFGLTEVLGTTIEGAQFVSNPGCLSSSCALTAYPLVRAGKTRKVIFDAKTGTSGAGRSPSTPFHHPHSRSNARAYKVFEHRHHPEIVQALEHRCEVVFTPHVIPTSRGIYVTAYIELEEDLLVEDLWQLYRVAYSRAPFIRLIEELPELQYVLGSNFCDITLRMQGRQVIVMSASDNLLKGMCGSALQNINLMCGLDETTGLEATAVVPV